MIHLRISVKILNGGVVKHLVDARIRFGYHAVMRLDTYLRQQGLTSAQFAEVSGIGHKHTIWNYRHGLRFPTPARMRLIERATGGVVTAQDFMRHHEELSGLNDNAATVAA